MISLTAYLVSYHCSMMIQIRVSVWWWSACPLIPSHVQTGAALLHDPLPPRAGCAALHVYLTCAFARHIGPRDDGMTEPRWRDGGGIQLPTW